jgi:hypothetical protein
MRLSRLSRASRWGCDGFWAWTTVRLAIADECASALMLTLPHLIRQGQISRPAIHVDAWRFANRSETRKGRKHFQGGGTSPRHPIRVFLPNDARRSMRLATAGPRTLK